MERKVRLTIIGVGSFIVFFIVYRFIIISTYTHSPDIGNCQKYYWLLTDSAIAQTDDFICVGWSTESDELFSYIYKKKYYIDIWGFKYINVHDVKKIKILESVDLSNVEFESGEVLHSNSCPKFKVRLKLPFENYFQVNIDKYSKIIKRFERDNYIGFLGNMKKMSFSNREDEHLILIDFSCDNYNTLTFFTILRGRFYMIMINSNETLDENILRIFKLDQK